MVGKKVRELQKPDDVGEVMSTLASLSAPEHKILRALSSSSVPMRAEEVAQMLGLHSNTVREVLTALCQRELVTRTRASTQGRGRPSWLYSAEVTVDPAQVATQFSNFAMALAKNISVCPQLQEVSAKIGKTWADEVISQAKIPSHAHIDAAMEAKRLDVHVAKIQVFFSRLGFEARQGHSEGEIQLHRCPLSTPDSSAEDMAPLCQIHGEMVKSLIETLSQGQLTTKTVPFAGPGYCQVSVFSKADAE